MVTAPSTVTALGPLAVRVTRGLVNVRSDLNSLDGMRCCDPVHSGGVNSDDGGFECELHVSGLEDRCLKVSTSGLLREHTGSPSIYVLWSAHIPRQSSKCGALTDIYHSTQCHHPGSYSIESLDAYCFYRRVGSIYMHGRHPEVGMSEPWENLNRHASFIQRVPTICSSRSISSVEIALKTMEKRNTSVPNLCELKPCDSVDNWNCSQYCSGDTGDHYLPRRV